MLRFTALIAIAAAHRVVAAAPMEHGEADGERFEYSTLLQGNGVIHLAGVVLGSNEDFVLHITRNGHVEGSFGMPIDFRRTLNT